ncbi:BrnT family toxin [Methylobacterium oryzihabitans]|uniref:BrnT family toxin n=1 Tax=Methylobacterium oryzihabitans TaxID=2499852 RepID=A0A437PHK3_9HYPH|nr:BrnT family toxin [Methylobacterium oryzihabitans]RVU21759.1 BrnT family toxin [Methylobacterium oryzihabitans]
MDFDWRDEKNETVRAGRGFGFEDAVGIFLGRTVEWQDTRQDYGEVRMVAVGETGGRFFTVVYTDRGPIRWIITAWAANRKERARWRNTA